jgi:hypothetical protein
MNEILTAIGLTFTAVSGIVIITWKIAGNYHTRSTLESHMDSCEERYKEIKQDFDKRLNGLDGKMDLQRREAREEFGELSRKLDRLVERRNQPRDGKI